MALQKLEDRAQSLADELARERDASGTEQLDALREVLEASFSLKQELIREDLQDMELELSKLRELVDQRHRARDRIVARRLVQLTGQDEHSQW